MKLLFGPLFLFIIFLASPRHNGKFKIQMSLVFMILSWVCVYNLYFRENVAYFETATGALYLVSSLLAASTWRKKNPDPSELISFECPFCRSHIQSLKPLYFL